MFLVLFLLLVLLFLTCPSLDSFDSQERLSTVVRNTLTWSTHGDNWMLDPIVVTWNKYQGFSDSACRVDHAPFLGWSLVQVTVLSSSHNSRYAFYWIGFLGQWWYAGADEEDGGMQVLGRYRQRQDRRKQDLASSSTLSLDSSESFDSSSSTDTSTSSSSWRDHVQQIPAQLGCVVPGRVRQLIPTQFVQRLGPIPLLEEQ